MTGGTCCSSDTPARCTGTFDVCTNTSDTYYLVRQWLCPSEPDFCGAEWEKEATELVQYINITGNENTTLFYKDSLCHYKIGFPGLAATKDIIMLKVLDKGIVDTQLTIFQASSLTSTPFNTTAFAREGLEINSTYPYDIYITIYARSDFTKYLSLSNSL